MLNIHHLELFYYVARHGGIAQAVRNMPYGIQQPAISAQIIALEDHLGTTLFRRRPFELTQVGRELYGFIEPFFGHLGEIEKRLCGGVSERLRVGASQTVLREHLPGILRDLRARHPSLQIVLRGGYQLDLERLLIEDAIDIAVTVIDRTVAAGLKSQILIELPLALVVPKTHRARSAAEILGVDRIPEALICMRPDEAVPRVFQQELAKRGIAWPATIEVATIELAATYAAEGFGIGLSVLIPGLKPPAGVRFLALEEFPKIPIGVLWNNRPSPVAEAFLGLLSAAARAIDGGGVEGGPNPGNPKEKPGAVG